MTFLEWLTQPRLSVRLLQEQLSKVEAERDHYRDLFVQALEQSRIIPRQAEHRTEQVEPEPQRLTRGEIEAEYLDNATREYEEFVAQARKRDEDLRTLMKPDTEAVQ
jgi:hypothetical protein